MKRKITAFGLTAKQMALLEAALPDGYALAQAQCVTDLELLDIPAEALPGDPGYVFHLPEYLRPQIRKWQKNHWLIDPVNIRFDFQQ